MVGGAFTYVAGLMASAVTAARCFARQIPVLATAVWSGDAGQLYLLVPSHGCWERAFASLSTSTVLGAGEGVLLWYVLSHRERSGAGTRLTETSYSSAFQEGPTES